MWQWWNSTISEDLTLHVNSNIPFLVEKSIEGKLGHLSADGALVVRSGKFTGRAAEDKYIVRDETTESIINWSSKTQSLSEYVFEELKNDLLRKFHLHKSDLYITEASAGAENSFALGVNIITSSPVHALFCRLIMRQKKDRNPLGVFTIYHDPDFLFDNKKYGLRSPTVIALNFKKREIVIGGTGYCGEIKKAVFTVMNTLLPEYDVLPLHSGANADSKGNVSVFFGLSGTGKTTLSTDVDMNIIGDDEHGISERGIFNFEGGCYAKTFNLKSLQEPDIFSAISRFGSLMENVVLDDYRKPQFEDKSITENGRAAYPLTALTSIINDGCGRIPSNFFFLSADAMGVLPLISKLDQEQAIYYFLLGYTAKVAGTESGMNGITATFSHCFGAPFMVRHPEDYGDLLKKTLEKHQIKVWLINTGWYGGPYGIGRRYDLGITRSCIRAIQRGDGDNISFTKDAVFDLSIPDTLPGVETKFLHPELLWNPQSDYLDAAKELKKLFDENVYKRGSPSINRGQIDAGI